MASKNMGGMRGAGSNARGFGNYGQGGAKPVARPVAKAKVSAKQTPKPTKTPTLYHGSAYPFKKGDVVRAMRRKNGGASATPSYEMANSYAQGRGALIPKGLQGQGKSPRVFKVKPVSTAVQSKKFNGLEFNDAKGFKVVREAKVPKPVKPTMKTSPKPPLKGTSPKKRK